jgi:hypothetical protein
MAATGAQKIDEIPRATSSKPNLARRILKLALYILYLVVILELMARVIVWPDRVLQAIHRWPFDSSSNRLLWVRGHHGRRGPDNPIFTYDSLRGWAVSPNLKEMSVFEGKVLNSNSRGIRGKVEYAEIPSFGKKRIVVLGSSFTFGDEVSDNETYAHYLEMLLPNTEILNLGVGGYGHDQMLLYFKEEGVKYHPDIVLLGFGWRDTWWNIVGFSNYWKPRFEMRNHQLVLTHVPVPRPEEILREEIYRSKLSDLGVIFWHELGLRRGFEQNEVTEITAAIFDEIVSTCQRIGATPVFVYLPVQSDLFDTQEGLSPGEQPLSRYCKSRDIPCVFLRPAFRAARAKGVALYTRSHWQPHEHMIAARALKDFLVEKGFIQVP